MMPISRSRVLLRGVLAAGIAMVFAATAVTELFVGEGGGFVAPTVALGIGAIALAGLAWSALSLYGATASARVDPQRAAGARPGYHLARWGLLAIVVAGLGAGVVTWLAYDEITNFGVAIWATGIVLLVNLLLIRRHGRDLRAVTG
jgi:hypothetical protein